MINNKEDVPLRFYAAKFAELDPAGAAARTGLAFDAERRTFRLTLMGTDYTLAHPGGEAVPDSLRPNERILLFRYLCEGRFRPGSGRQIAYNETPWGGVYARQFEGRVLTRAAYAFTTHIEDFRNKVEASSLAAEHVGRGDAGYRFAFLNNFHITLLLYAGDDEFPPSAQMLFDDTFVGAFSAEDMAVAGEIVIQRLKNL